MISVRKAKDRFHTNIDWLDSWHTFSFGHHYDPSHMGFSDLRVINDDIVHGGGGFATHPHKDMEIITVVLRGELAHKDSLGNGSSIVPGDVQKMSAGTGIRHSEFNASATESVHLLQLWIQPSKQGVQPAYWQQHFASEARRGKWCLVVSPDEAEGSIPIYQDARLYVTELNKGHELKKALDAKRNYWLHLATGDMSANGEKLQAGDGIAISGETALNVAANAESSAILFDLAA
jgi:redox-sensitive bicupin YhaK (pirin superfamily)